MKTRRATYSLLIILAALFIFIISRLHEPRAREALDRHPAHLYYTRHALCRMECRHIDKEEITEIIENGIINFNKSARNAKPCPTFAVQGETSSGEKIRVILAQCSNETRVVTCYNLQEDFDCSCPGDPNPQKH